MDETFEMQELDIQKFMRPKCPVSIGDRFYRKIKNQTIPDRLEVISIKPMKDVMDGYFIVGRYMYHGIGQTERTFSDVIFKDPDWVIEKKGRDF